MDNQKPGNRRKADNAIVNSKKTREKKTIVHQSTTQNRIKD